MTRKNVETENFDLDLLAAHKKAVADAKENHFPALLLYHYATNQSELTESDIAKVSLHLVDCERCRDQVNTLLKINQP